MVQANEKEREYNEKNNEKRGAPAKVIPLKKKRQTPLPEDFKLTAELLERAKAKGVNRSETEQLFDTFKSWAKSNDKHYVDWNEAFMTWVYRRAGEIKQEAAKEAKAKMERICPPNIYGNGKPKDPHDGAETDVL